MTARSRWVIGVSAARPGDVGYRVPGDNAEQEFGASPGDRFPITPPRQSSLPHPEE